MLKFMRRTTWICTIAVLTLASAALAGCGDSSGGGAKVSAKEWVDGYCKAFGPLGETLTGLGSGIQDLGSDATAEELQDQTIKEFDQAAQEIEDVRRRLDTAGTPDVENGKEIVDLLNQGLDATVAAFNEISDQVKAIDAEDAAGFGEAFATIDQAAAYGELDKLGTDLESLDADKTIENAISDSKTCQEADISPR